MRTSAQLGCVALLALGSCQQQGVEVLLVVDQDAGGPDFAGGVFRVDPRTREVSLFAASPLFVMPQDIMQLEDGSFLLLDYNGKHGKGKIFALAPDGEVLGEVALPEGLLDPYQFERAPDGSIWILDNNADPRGLVDSPDGDTGTVWRLSRDLQRLEVIATGPPIKAPSGLVFANGDALILDADAYQVGGFSFDRDEGAIFRVRRGSGELETLVRLRRMVSPLGFFRESAQSFLVVDANADPNVRDRIHGAVYRVDASTGSAEVFADHADFRDPHRLHSLERQPTGR